MNFADLPLSDRIAGVSAGLSLIFGIVSLLALGVAVYAIRRGNRNTSVATLVTLNEGFRQAWQRFLNSQGADQDYEFAELMNLLEIACAIDFEGSLSGVSHEISKEYLSHNILLLEKNPDAGRRIEAAVHDQTTFKYVRIFRERMRKRVRLIGPH